MNTDKNGIPLVQGKADILGYGIVPDYTSTPTKVSASNDIIMTVRATVGFVSKLGFAACIGRTVFCRIKKVNGSTFNRVLYLMRLILTMCLL